MGQEEQFKQEGNQHYAEGEFAKAVAAYNKALKADPENGVLYSNRAAAFLQLGKEVKAIKDADSTIALKPDWAKGYFRKGAALAQLRRWDEAVESLKKALEIEPKNKEVAMLLRDTNRKRAEANGERKREASKGAKLGFGRDSSYGAQDANNAKGVAAGTAPQAGAEGGGGGGAGAQGAPIGFSESVIENFVRETLTNAITQFAQQGELKSIVYVQPAVQGEEMRMVGIEAAFASPSAHGECVNYLRTFVADNKALAVIVIAEKRNIAFPQVWQERTKAQWQWGEGEQGIFMQLDAVAPGATHKATERKLWFIPTGAGKQGTPREPVELSVDDLAIFPPLLR